MVTKTKTPIKFGDQNGDQNDFGDQKLSGDQKSRFGDHFGDQNLIFGDQNLILMTKTNFW